VSRTPPPSAAQRRLLEAAARHRQGRLVGGDPRTRQILVDREWVELDGYYFGPLFKITPLGRQAVASREEAYWMRPKVRP
jgi:hypothetical protein